MLAIFNPGELPPIPLGTFFPETDRASYSVISAAVDTVKKRCIDDGGDVKNFKTTYPGWITTGWFHLFWCSSSYVII